MGFFSRLLGSKKDEDEAIRPPVRQEAARVTRGGPPRSAPSSISSPEERKRIEQIVSQSLDDFSDAVGEMIETGNWGVGKVPSKTPATGYYTRFRDTPFTDEKGNLRPEIAKGLAVAEKPWGGYDPAWNAVDAANRYYESFPQDIGEKEFTVDSGDDAMYVKELQATLAYNTDNVDREVSKLLPKGPKNIKGDDEGIMWYINSDGFGSATSVPWIDDTVNWLATVRNSAAGIKKDLEGIEDGVLRTMLLNYLDEQNDLVTRMYMRFSGCGQRVQRMREAFVMWNGVPKSENGTLCHELEDYKVVRQSLLHYGRMWYHGLFTAKGEEHARDADVDREYYAENDDFAGTSLSMRRVYAILSMCCCMKYALDNLRAYSAFAYPVVRDSMDRHLADINNYLSFRGYTDDGDPGKKYHEIFQKVKTHTFDRLNELGGAMLHYLKENGKIASGAARSAMHVARAHESESQIRWGLTDALWRRMDLHEKLAISTPEFRYFVPWSAKPGELLEIGGIRERQRDPGGAR